MCSVVPRPFLARERRKKRSKKKRKEETGDEATTCGAATTCGINEGMVKDIGEVVKMLGRRSS